MPYPNCVLRYAYVMQILYYGRNLYFMRQHVCVSLCVCSCVFVLGHTVCWLQIIIISIHAPKQRDALQISLYLLHASPATGSPANICIEEINYYWLVHCYGTQKQTNKYINQLTMTGYDCVKCVGCTLSHTNQDRNMVTHCSKTTTNKGYCKLLFIVIRAKIVEEIIFDLPNASLFVYMFLIALRNAYEAFAVHGRFVYVHISNHPTHTHRCVLHQFTLIQTSMWRMTTQYSILYLYYLARRENCIQAGNEFDKKHREEQIHRWNSIKTYTYNVYWQKWRIIRHGPAILKIM